MPIIPNDITSLLDEYFVQNPVEETEEIVEEPVLEDPVKTDEVEEITEIVEPVNPFQQLFDEVIETIPDEQKYGGQQLPFMGGNITMPSYVDEIWDPESQTFILDSFPEEGDRNKAEEFNAAIEEQKSLAAAAQESWNRITSVTEPGKSLIDDETLTEYKYDLRETDEGYQTIDYFTKPKDGDTWQPVDLKSEEAIDIVDRFGHLEGDKESYYTYNLAAPQTLDRAQQYAYLGWGADETVNEKDLLRITGEVAPNMETRGGFFQKLIDKNSRTLIGRAGEVSDDPRISGLGGTKFTFEKIITNEDLDILYPFKWYKKNNDSDADADEFVNEYYKDIPLAGDRLEDFKGWLQKNDLIDDFLEQVKVSDILGQAGRFNRGTGPEAESFISFADKLNPGPIFNNIMRELVQKVDTQNGQVVKEMVLSTYLNTYMNEVDDRAYRKKQIDWIIEHGDESRKGFYDTDMDPSGGKQYTRLRMNTSINEALNYSEDHIDRVTFFDNKVHEDFIESAFPAYYNSMQVFKDKKEAKQQRQANSGYSLLDGLVNTIFVNAPQSFEAEVQNLGNWTINMTNSMIQKVLPEDGVLGGSALMLDRIVNNYAGIHSDEKYFDLLEKDWGGYSTVFGKTATMPNGVEYIKDARGVIYNTSSKFTLGSEDPDYKKISEALDASEEYGKSFSLRGFSEQTSTIVGGLGAQIVLTRGVGLMSGPMRLATLARINGFKNTAHLKVAMNMQKMVGVKPLTGALKLPISQGMVDAIIAQGTYFSSVGYNRVLNEALNQSLSMEDAQKLAKDAASKYAAVGMITAPIAPLQKWNQGAVNEIRKKQINKSLVSDYIKKGKNSAFNTFAQRIGDVFGKYQLPARVFAYEGGREIVQENVQQSMEIYGINPYLNRQLSSLKGTPVANSVFQDYLTGQEVFNLSTQAFVAGGLGSSITNPDVYTQSPDTLTSLYFAGQNIEETTKTLTKLVSQDVISTNEMNQILEDIKAVRNTVGTLPKWIPSEYQLITSRLQNKLNNLKNKRKEMKMEGVGLEVINDQINDVQMELDGTLQPLVEQLFQKLNLGVETIAGQLGQDFFKMDAEGVKNKIKEILAENKDATVDEKNSNDYATFITIPATENSEERNVILINEDSSLEDKQYTSGQHEGFHGLVAALVTKYKKDVAAWEKGGKKGEAPKNVVSELGLGVINELKNNPKIKFNDDKYARRVLSYINDETIDPDTILEEIMPLLSEALTQGSIEIESDVGDKLGDIFRRFKRSFGINSKFKEGKDVIDLIRDYNLAVEKNKGLNLGLLQIAKGEIDVELEGDVDQAKQDIVNIRKASKPKQINKKPKRKKRKTKSSKKLDLDEATTNWQKGEDVDIENVIIPQLEAAVISSLGRWGVTGGRNVNPETWKRRDVMKELKQEVGKQLWSFMSNFDVNKSSATTYANNLALRIGPALIEMFAPKGKSLDKMKEDQGFTPPSVQTRDFDENQDEDLGRPLVYPSEIDAIAGEIEALIEPIINKVSDKLVGKGGFFPSVVGKKAIDVYSRMGNKTTNQKKKANKRITPTPEEFVKYLINYATKSTDVRADIKGIIGRYSDQQYEEFVTRAIRGGLIKSIPIKTIKRRFKNVEGFELKKTFRQDNVQYYDVPRVGENALIDYLIGAEVSGSNIKGRDKRYNSFVSMLGEGVMVETLGNLKSNPSFMKKLGDLLEINNSPLTAQEFITEVENLLDARTVERASLDTVKASKKLDTDTMNDLGQAKDISAVRKLLNIGKVPIQNYTQNSSKKDLESAYKTIRNSQENLIDYITDYGITSNTLQGSAMANFGAFKVRRKNGVVYYAVININTGKQTWVKGVYTKTTTNKRGESIKQYKKPSIDLENKTFLPSSKGANALFWGTADPQYKRAEKIAKSNNSDSKKSRNRRINLDKTIINKAFINKILGNKDGSGKVSRQQIMDNNMNVLEDSMLELERAVELGMPIEYAVLFISQSYQGTSGMIKTAAPFRYVYSDLKPGQEFREEHNPPASVIGGYLIYGIKQGAVDEIMDKVRKNYYQTQIPIINDNQINNANLQMTIPSDTSLDTNSAVRLIDAKQDLNKYVNPRNNQSLADDLKLPLDAKNRTPDNINDQRNIARQVIVNGLDIKEGQKQIKSSKKVNNESSKQVNNNKDNLFPLIKANSTTEDSIKVMGDADTTVKLAIKASKKQKGISVFDFDDTLAFSNSQVIVNMPDGTTKEITPAQFAKTAEDLEAQGAVFNFDQFNKVIDGRKGPLADLALKRQGKFGSGDIFVLTARPQLSAPAIKMFLDGIGLNIAIENITGLENGSPDAKALWVLDKTAQGYNDFYFADDSLANVQAVKNILDQVDVKSKVQQAKASKKIDLDKEFNVIIEQQSDKKWFKNYSDARAQVEGKKANKFEFFIPPSAEDFVGLMYKFLPKGKDGDRAMQWLKDNLFDPFNKAEQEIIAAKIAVSNDFTKLRESIDNIPKNLEGESGHSNFTWSQALRVYIWDMQGMEIPGLSTRDLNALKKLISSNPDMKVFAEKIAFIQKGKDYPAPNNDWVGGNITSDIISNIQKVFRKDALQEWQENVDIIFSKKNLNKLQALYGSNYVKALKGMLGRMKSGSNRSMSNNAQVDNVIDWINNSVGTTMFLNRKSALLQLISSVNFINWSDNNIYAAGKAFANQPQYWKDVMYLLNSDYLIQRRNGMKINVAESEIAEASKRGGMKGVVAYLLNKGFVFTRIADSLAIAVGGATFYRNRVNKLQNTVNIDTGKLYTKQQAEEQAFDDFYQISEESQQSSRTDRISMQQASGLGRVVLNYANTPMQYARIIKRSTQDLLAGRGDWKSNVSKIVYYGTVQNLIFNALQQALFVFMFDDDDKEKQDRTVEDKAYGIGFGMLSSLLRGLGYGGALVDTLISMGREISIKEDGLPSFSDDFAWNMFDFSPTLDTKARKIRNIRKTFLFKESRDQIKRRGFNLENPAYLAVGQVVSSVFNVPLDRVLRLAMSLKQASDRDTALWQRFALSLGYTSWSVGLPYWGTLSTIGKENKEDEEIKNKYDNDTRKLKTRGYKRIPMTRGKPDGVLIDDYIEVTRPNGRTEYWLTPNNN